MLARLDERIWTEDYDPLPAILAALPTRAAAAAAAAAGQHGGGTQA